MEQVSVNSEKEKKTMQSSLPSTNHAVATDVGKKRSQNQDSFGFAETERSKLFVVADGMGGSNSGEVASQLTAQIAARACFDDHGLVSKASLKRGIQSANKAIHFLGKHTQKYKEMGSTIVSLAFTKDEVIYAHVGDSRIYYYHRGGLIRLTKDHTLIQQLLDEGQITEDQAKSHPFNHVLLHSVGGNDETEITVGSLRNEIEIGDKFLLCCDGLTNHVTDQEIADIIANLGVEDATQCLISLANHRGGTDNITVEVVEVMEQGESVDNTPSLAHGELAAVFSRDLEKEFEDIIRPYGEHLSEIDAGELKTEVLALVSTPTEDLFQSTSLGFILNEVSEEEEQVSDEQEPSVDGNPEVGAQDREGLAFDTMIFEGDSIDDILELRELYFQAKSMGTDKLSEVLAGAKETAVSSSGGKGLFKSAAMFISGGLAFLFLGQNIPQWLSSDKPTVVASSQVNETPVREASPLALVGEKELGLDVSEPITDTPPVKTTVSSNIKVQKPIDSNATDKVDVPDATLAKKAEEALARAETTLKEPLPEFSNDIVQVAAIKKEVVTPPVVKKEVVAPPVVKKEVVTPSVVKKEVVAPPAVKKETKIKEASSIRKEEQARIKAKNKEKKAEKQLTIRRLDSKLANLDSSIISLKDQLSKARQSSKRAKAKASKSKDLSNLQSKLSQQRAELKKWQGLQTNSGSGNIRSVAEQVAPVSNQVKTTLSELKQTSAELETVRRQVKRNPSFDLKKKRKTLEARLALTTKQLRQRVNIGAKNRITALNKEVNSLSGQVAAAGKAAPRAARSAQADRQKINALSKELKDLEKARTTVQNELKSLR